MLASGRLLLATVLISIYLPVQTGWADTQTIVMGGQTGLAWNSGGGQIEAVFQTGPREVDTGNTPGGVIQFDPEGRGGGFSPSALPRDRISPLACWSAAAACPPPPVWRQA